MVRVKRWVSQAVERGVAVSRHLLERDAQGRVDGAGASRVREQRLAGALGGRAGRERDPRQQGDARPGLHVEGEAEVVAGGDREVAEAAAPLVEAIRVPVRHHRGQERPDLELVAEPRGGGQVLLQDLLRAASGDVAAVRAERAEVAARARLDGDRVVLVHREPRRGHERAAGAAGLPVRRPRACRRERERDREASEPGGQPARARAITGPGTAAPLHR